jgi:hypothetical protein
MTMPKGYAENTSYQKERKFCANCGHVQESHESGDGGGTMPKGMKAKPSTACILCFCSEFREKKHQHHHNNCNNSNDNDKSQNQKRQ